MKDIGLTLRKIRESKGLSQDYIAGKIGISQNSYSKIESGETNLTINRLTSICDALEVGIIDILSSTSGQKIKIQNNQAVIGHVENLSLSPMEKEIWNERIQLLEKEIEFLKGRIK